MVTKKRARFKIVFLIALIMLAFPGAVMLVTGWGSNFPFMSISSVMLIVSLMFFLRTLNEIGDMSVFASEKKEKVDKKKTDQAIEAFEFSRALRKKARRRLIVRHVKIAVAASVAGGAIFYVNGGFSAMILASAYAAVAATLVGGIVHYSLD
jgi:hypothetical protein